MNVVLERWAEAYAKWGASQQMALTVLILFLAAGLAVLAGYALYGGLRLGVVALRGWPRPGPPVGPAVRLAEKAMKGDSVRVGY